MHSKRSRYGIILAILQVTVNGATITKIVYGANINFKMAQKYLEYLTENGFIEIYEKDSKKCYRKTEKGLKFQKKLEELEEFDNK